MTTSRRFARVYFDDLERDYPSIYYDPTCLSTWLRLLILSEKSWPSLPELPRAARRADLEKLRAEGVMVDHPNERFELKGWVKERGERARVARENVGKRSDRTTVPTTVDTTVPTVVPSTVLPVRAGASFSSSVSTSPTEGVQGEPNAWDAFMVRTGEVPGPKIRGWLDELSEAHSESRVAAMIGRIPKTQSNPTEYLKAVRDALRAEDMAEERAEREREKAAIAKKRAPVKFVPAPVDISPDEAKRMAAEYIASTKGAA